MNDLFPISKFLSSPTNSLYLDVSIPWNRWNILSKRKQETLIFLIDIRLIIHSVRQRPGLRWFSRGHVELIRELSIRYSTA